MPMDLTAFGTDYANIIEDMPADTASDDAPVFVYGDDSVSCCRSGTSEQHDVDVPGFIKDYDEEIMALVADFTTQPEPGKTGVLEGVTMRIDRTMISPDGQAIHLFLTGI